MVLRISTTMCNSWISARTHTFIKLLEHRVEADSTQRANRTGCGLGFRAPMTPGPSRSLLSSGSGAIPTRTAAPLALSRASRFRYAWTSRLVQKHLTHNRKAPHHVALQASA